ncbi:MAG TPA: transglutaminaseTgpA domain-containing protein, partial [Acidimicrobiales bacterium]
GALVVPDQGGGGGGGGGSSDRPRSGQGTIGYFAFAESFDTSVRGRPDRTVVMRVRAPAPDFWRGQTFEQWDGRRWTVAEEQGQLEPGPVINVGSLEGDPSLRLPGDELVQTYYIEQRMPNLVFSAYRPERLFIDAGVWVRPDGALRADTTLEPDTVYTVVSRRPRVTADLLSAQGGPRSGPVSRFWSDPAMQRFTQLPDTTTDRVRALALELTAPHPAVVDKVRAIEAWLAANTVYDLSAPVPPAGADAVDHFLFESRRGFCEQISTSLTVMLRAVGIPSRVAAGYTPGRWDPFAGVWVVEAQDAHAWTEVWFPATGWQSFDPTATVPFAGDTLDRGTLGGPIAAAVGRALLAAMFAVVVLVPFVGLAAVVMWLVRRRRQHNRVPFGVAQRRFVRAAERVGVAVGPADTNPAIGAAIGKHRPDAAEAAARAARLVDAAAFGGVDADSAEHAVRELDAALR